MKWTRRVLQVTGGVAAGIGLALLLVPSVQATNGGYSGHAAGYFDNGDSWGGGYVQTEVANLSADGNSYANEELWVGGIGKVSDSYSEVGYSSNQPDCGTGLSWFWDDDNDGSPSRIYCGTSTPVVGTWHQLEVQQTLANTWTVYIDGYAESPTFTMSTGDYNTNAEAGLEYHYSDGVSLTGDAYFSYNEVRSTSCCTWEYWPAGSPTTEQVDFPSVFNWTWTQDYIHGYDYRG